MTAVIDELNALLAEILRVSALVKLSGQPEHSEKEISDYAFLMEKREPMIEKALALKKKLEETADPSDRKKTNTLIEEIIALDRAQAKTMKQIQQSVKGSIREIKSGKKLSHAYANPSDYAYSAGLLDTKK